MILDLWLNHFVDLSENNCNLGMFYPLLGQFPSPSITCLEDADLFGVLALSPDKWKMAVKISVSSKATVFSSTD